MGTVKSLDSGLINAIILLDSMRESSFVFNDGDNNRLVSFHALNPSLHLHDVMSGGRSLAMLAQSDGGGVRAI